MEYDKFLSNVQTKFRKLNAYPLVHYAYVVSYCFECKMTVNETISELKLELGL